MSSTERDARRVLRKRMRSEAPFRRLRSPAGGGDGDSTLSVSTPRRDREPSRPTPLANGREWGEGGDWLMAVKKAKKKVAKKKVAKKKKK